MSNTPSNPFANLTPPNGNVIGGPSQPAGGGPGVGQQSGRQQGQQAERRTVSRFTALKFDGTGLQLFGVQAVNLLLTVVTLGIWIPWARARKRRFFYNNTQILGEGIDYLATGFDLFKGWVIISILVAGFYALPFLGLPFVQEAISGLLFLVYPWAINKTLRFNARSLAWRDVRFNFQGGYWASFWYFFILPIIGILSLGLLVPLASKAMRSYIARNYSFGGASFVSEAGVLSYYGAGIKTLLLFIIFAGVILGSLYGVLIATEPTQLMALSAALQSGDIDTILQDVGASSVMTAIPVAFFVLFFATATYYRALTRNLMVGSLRLDGGVRFRSNLSGGVLAWIMITNALLVIMTAGLLWPWAQVRKYRYMAESTDIRPVNDMNGFIDKQLKSGHSVGDALGEAGGIGVEF